MLSCLIAVIFRMANSTMANCKQDPLSQQSMARKGNLIKHLPFALHAAHLTFTDTYHLLKPGKFSRSPSLPVSFLAFHSILVLCLFRSNHG